MKSIKEIATGIGVSKQAVWQRVKRSTELSAMLAEHSKTINGKVYIDEVLEMRILEQYPARYVDETSVNVDETSVNIGVNVDKTAANVDETAVNVDETSININKLLIETLQQQLAFKDKQIEKLETELSEERQHSRNLSDRLIVLTDQAQQLQALQLTAKQDEEPTQFVETPSQNVDEQGSEIVSEKGISEQEVPSEKKKSWRERLGDWIAGRK